MNPNARPILVIGGGVAGMTAALEAAEVGCRVVLVEKGPILGGRVMQMHRYFPKMCPPACGFEINVRRIRQNPRITVHTLATVEGISGGPGAFRHRGEVHRHDHEEAAVRHRGASPRRFDRGSADLGEGRSLQLRNDPDARALLPP